MTERPPPLLNDPFYACLTKAGIPAYLRDRFDEDAEDNLEAYISSSAPSTLACFRTDISRWIAACGQYEFDALNPRARHVRDFIREFETGRKPATVKRMVGNIGMLASGIAGNKNVCHTKVVRSELKRLRREHGSHHKQALAIRQLGEVASMDAAPEPFSIKRMLDVLEPDKSLSMLRGKLILSLCGDTGRRSSEYYLSNFAHLQPGPNGTGTFHVDRSKTDQDGNGLVRFVSPRTMRLLAEWRSARTATGEIVTDDSPLLRAVHRQGWLGQRLCHVGYQLALRATVRRALTILSAEHRELISLIDDVVTRISGHSFRVGMVQDLITAGETVASICIEGGWQTASMVMVYGRNIDVRNGACARLSRKLADE